MMHLLKKTGEFLLAAFLAFFGSGASDGTAGLNGLSQELYDAPVKAHFIDVGQGDSIFIQLPGEKTMLIDAGDNKSGITVENYLKDFDVDRIDYLVATHPHADHIGGMDDIINMFDIGEVFMPDATENTKSFESVLDALESKSLGVTKAEAGVNICRDGELSVDIIAPYGSKYDGTNNASAVVYLKYGSNAFLFTGDAETESESIIMKNYEDIHADVLKIGHHGSSTSTSEEFLSRVNPEAAVISVGKDNKYGHPAKDIVDRLKSHDVKMFRTDEDGSVVIGCDGENIIY